MFIIICRELPNAFGRNYGRVSLKFTFGREGAGDEGIRRQDGLGLPTLPHLARSGKCTESRKEKGLGCGIHQAD